MSNLKFKDWEIDLYREATEDIKKGFKPYEIDVMIKIYRWTKSEHNSYFFSTVCKREYNYKKALKKLRTRNLIRLVKGNDPHKITKDGIRMGYLMLLCRDLGFL